MKKSVMGAWNGRRWYIDIPRVNVQGGCGVKSDFIVLPRAQVVDVW